MENNNDNIFPNTAQGTRIAWLLPAVTALPCFIVFLFASQLHLSEDIRSLAGIVFLLHAVLVVFLVPVSTYWAFSVFSIHCRLKKLTAGKYPISPIKAFLAVSAPIPVALLCAILVLLSRFLFDLILSRLLHLTSFHEDSLQFAYKCAIFGTGIVPVWICAFVGWQQWIVLKNLVNCSGPVKLNSLLSFLIPTILVAPPVLFVASLDPFEPAVMLLIVQLPLLVLIWVSCLLVQFILAKSLSKLRTNNHLLQSMPNLD